MNQGVFPKRVQIIDWKTLFLAHAPSVFGSGAVAAKERSPADPRSLTLIRSTTDAVDRSGSAKLNRCDKCHSGFFAEA